MHAKNEAIAAMTARKAGSVRGLFIMIFPTGDAERFGSH
jgi:hypothetical protein